jgi:hypothetical protein
LPWRQNNTLEDVTQNVALAETSQPVLGERRVMRNPVVEVSLQRWGRRAAGE